MNYLLDRLKEPSTWRGLAVMVGAFGVHMHPDLMPAIGTAVIAAIGLVEVVRKG